MRDYGTPLSLEHYPAAEMVWQRDLQNYEGPFLMEYRGPGDGVFLVSWCDQDGPVTRWLVVPADPQDITGLLAGERFLRDVLVQGLSRGGRLIDRDLSGRVQRVLLVLPGELPEDYLPVPGLGLLPELILGAKQLAWR